MQSFAVTIITPPCLPSFLTATSVFLEANVLRLAKNAELRLCRLSHRLFKLHVAQELGSRLRQHGIDEHSEARFEASYPGQSRDDT
jgi:hypothetical protein